MQSAQNFPHWDYENHRDRLVVLRTETDKLYLDLLENRIDAKVLIADTRDAHRRLFSRLTPKDQPHLAGHYRGENFPYLKHCNVTIASNQNVGCPPQQIRLELSKLDQIAQVFIARLDRQQATPNPLISEGEKLMEIVRCVARISAQFLAIHPYANGNGHIGRAIMVALLGRYGHWPAALPIEPRPSGQDYSDAIRRYQHGEPVPFEVFLMNAIKG
jgi:fido (protein-threonine AMPylation protein)